MEGAIMRSSSRAGKSLAFAQELKVVNPESMMSDYDPQYRHFVILEIDF
jgi:hypothetical protein